VEAVTGVKQRRLRRLATRWLAEQAPTVGFAEVRFDVACVTLQGAAGPGVEVIEAAF
jgi:Holliday junction resolvase-like predicted endonuclease